jgi:hypothetical protein
MCPGSLHGLVGRPVAGLDAPDSFLFLSATHHVEFAFPLPPVCRPENATRDGVAQAQAFRVGDAGHVDATRTHEAMVTVVDGTRRPLRCQLALYGQPVFDTGSLSLLGRPDPSLLKFLLARG